MQLYNLNVDIGELTNVIDDHPGVVEKLIPLLTSYVENGRSTPGVPQPNTGGSVWDQLWWMTPNTGAKM